MSKVTQDRRMSSSHGVSTLDVCSSGQRNCQVCTVLSKNYKWEIHLSWSCKPHSSQATEKGLPFAPLSLLYFTRNSYQSDTDVPLYINERALQGAFGF